MKPHERPFVIGRRTRKGTTVVLVRPETVATPLMRGPWTLRAVVTPDPAPGH